MTKRLIFLPVSPLGGFGGYHKAAAYDLHKLGTAGNDHIIIYDNNNQPVPENYDIITRPSTISWRRIINTLQGRVSTEVSPKQLEEIVRNNDYDEIFCGDVMLYHSLRSVFPQKKMTVRFHNLFHLCKTRQMVRGFRVNFKFRLNLKLFSALEAVILNDDLVHPIFINKTEQDYFNLLFPGRASDLWQPHLYNQIIPLAPKFPKIIYFGSYAQHQMPGILWFLTDVFKPLHDKWPMISMHFWGRGGGNLNNPPEGIVHHGDFTGDGLPMEGEGIFINPDLLGGGIKIKVGEWLDRGVPFISTPYGVEGYAFTRHKHINICDTRDWFGVIESYFTSLDLIT